jgi:hypothetical protein
MPPAQCTEPPFVAMFHLLRYERMSEPSDASEQIILRKGLAQLTDDTGGGCALPNAAVRIRRDQHG